MRINTLRRLALASIACGLSCSSAGRAAAPFRIAVLPDTQYYCQDNTADPTKSLFHDQVNWILSNRAAQNIAFVTHLGDVVNVAGPAGAASAQWPVATNAMQLLRNSSLPFNILPGNHDWTSTAGTGSIEHYRARFGDQANYFAGKTWHLGYDARGVNSAVRFDTPIGPMLNLSLEFNFTSPTAIAGAPANSIAWAQSIIDANPGVPTIISTHNAINPGAGRDGFGQSLFKSLVRDNNQVFLVLNGHYTGNDNEQDLMSLNRYGRAVFERGVDYQNNANGGDGWMNLIEIDADAKKMRLVTYSPKSNADLSGDLGGAAGAAYGGSGTVRTDYDSAFSRDFDVAARFAVPRTEARTTPVRFQQGVNGYTGAVDVKIDQVNANTSYASNPTIDVDGDTTAGNDSQALVRFDNVFGSGSGQIAADRDVTRATLRVYVDASVSNSPGSGLLAHRLLQPFNATGTTWTSLTNGISADGLEAAYTEDDSVGASNGSENVKAGTWIELDVTRSLRAMRNGAANHGWALLPWDGGSNAVIFNSSESGNIATRPQLVVEATQQPVATRSFRNGVNGYSGTTDTWVDQTNVNVANGSDALIRVDGGANNADYLSNDLQGLIRFDAAFGAGGDQVPMDDVRITSAFLKLSVSAATNAEGSGFALHRMRRDWNGSSSWASLTGGVALGDDATTTPDDTLGEDANVVAVQSGLQYVDVTASVRAWIDDAEPNYGWAIMPLVKGTDAVLFDSSEAASVTTRPELVVRYIALAPATWTSPSSGTWATTTNWLDADSPSAAGRTVLFGYAITSATTVTVADARLAGTLRFDSEQPYTISGASTLTLKRAAGPARIHVLRGHHAIDAPLSFAGDADLFVEQGASLRLGAARFESEQTASLVKTGGGTATLNHVRLASLSIEEGEMQLGGSGAGVSTVVAQLNVASGARLSLVDGAVVIDYAAGASSPFQSVLLATRAGRIGSASGDSAIGLACVEAAITPAIRDWPLGAAIDTTAVVLVNALRGDANLDRFVNFDDLLILASNYNLVANHRWTTADFNADGVVNFDDLLQLAANYNRSALAPSGTLAAGGMRVPEPSVAIATVGGAIALLRRRRLCRDERRAGPQAFSRLEV